jgi:hypothetical protein
MRVRDIDSFEGRRWLTPLCEWALNALTAISIVALTAALVRKANDSGDWGNRTAAPGPGRSASASVSAVL